MTAVLYLTANPNRASSNVPTEGWFRLLEKKGLCPVLVDSREGAFPSWCREQGIPVYILPLPFPDKRKPWQYLAALWKLRRLVRRHRIELIHSIEHVVYPIAADLARVCRLPVVVGVHCRLDRGFSAWAFGRRRQPDRLFFLSQGSREVCEPAVGEVVPKSKWAMLPNGIDLEQFRPDAEAGLRFRAEHGLDGKMIVGAASWLRPGKQLEHMFEIGAALDSQRLAIVLAGGVAPGEEDYAERVSAMGRAKLGSRLKFVGCLDDLRGFYNALDLYINTSKEETCGISVMEAMACGCPVVGYPSVSVDEQVLPNGGEITAQDNIDALSAAVRKWISDPISLNSARHKARLQAERRFDIQKFADRLWDEYCQLVQSGRDPEPQFARAV